MDGYQLCKELRGIGENISIFMITAQQEIKGKHRGFLVGTDDYMTKPFDVQEMLFRIKALLCQEKMVNELKLTIGGTILDYNTLTVTHGEGTIALPQKVKKTVPMKMR